MSDDMYNLQVPIPIELKKELKKLADADDRSLRTFCRRILEGYINGSYTIDNSLRSENIKQNNVSDDTEDNTIEFDLNNID